MGLVNPVPFPDMVAEVDETRWLSLKKQFVNDELLQSKSFENDL